tara:strand:+ start:629 stop:793 length:165 start_codon:yes stop_codon:yes gene_type:complete
MAHLGKTVYFTIKDAIIQSTHPFGLIATYQDKNGVLYWFVNGRPSMSIGKPKKD